MRGGNPSSTLQLPPSSINEHISHVLYINLDNRTDRKSLLEKELEVFSPGKVTRIPGIKHKTKARGCTTGHLNAVKYAKEHNFPNVLILEDDATWSNIEQGYPVFEKLVKNPYDVIMLGATFVTYDPETNKLNSGNTASSYLINASYYTTIIDKLQSLLDNPDYDSLPYYEQIVDQKSYHDLQSTGNWFIVVPSLMIQRPGYSNLQFKKLNYKNYFI